MGTDRRGFLGVGHCCVALSCLHWRAPLPGHCFVGPAMQPPAVCAGASCSRSTSLFALMHPVDAAPRCLCQQALRLLTYALRSVATYLPSAPAALTTHSAGLCCVHLQAALEDHRAAVAQWDAHHGRRQTSDSSGGNAGKGGGESRAGSPPAPPPRPEPLLTVHTFGTLVDGYMRTANAAAAEQAMQRMRQEVRGQRGGGGEARGSHGKQAIEKRGQGPSGGKCMRVIMGLCSHNL